MRRFLCLTIIISFALLGVYDLCHAERRQGTAEVLLAVVNAILLL
jgi:hypothetical protein